MIDENQFHKMLDSLERLNDALMLAHKEGRKDDALLLVEEMQVITARLAPDNLSFFE